MPSPSVVFGGPSWEHDVSILTGLQALRVLTRSGTEPIGLYWSELNGWFRVPVDLEALCVPRRGAKGRPSSLS